MSERKNKQLASRAAKLPVVAPPPATPEIAKPLPPQIRALPSREIAELWFSLLRTKWTTLALVPAHAGGSALPLAQQLMGVGALARGKPPVLISAEGLGLPEMAEITLEMAHGSRWPMSGGDGDHEAQIDDGVLKLIVLEPIVTNPLGTALALSADAVLLCIEGGVTTLESARHTIDQIGPERFIGSVLLKPG